MEEAHIKTMITFSLVLVLTVLHSFHKLMEISYPCPEATRFSPSYPAGQMKTLELTFALDKVPRLVCFLKKFSAAYFMADNFSTISLLHVNLPLRYENRVMAL